MNTVYVLDENVPPGAVVQYSRTTSPFGVPRRRCVWADCPMIESANSSASKYTQTPPEIKGEVLRPILTSRGYFELGGPGMCIAPCTHVWVRLRALEMRADHRMLTYVVGSSAGPAGPKQLIKHPLNG